MTTKRKKVDAGLAVEGALFEDINDLGGTGTAKTIDVGLANVFTCVLTGNCTFTMSGAVAGKQCSVTLWVVRDSTTTRTIAFAGGTIATPGGVGIIQPLNTAFSTNQYIITSKDGGTSWLVHCVGNGYS